jgi:hypothetical protein
MTKKETLIAKAKEKGLTLKGNETIAELEALLAPAAEDGAPLAPTNPAPKRAARSEKDEEASFQKTANTMKAILDAQPKVAIYVPLEHGEPKGTQLPVEINGYRMNVPKGVPNVQVPQAVADIIWQSLGVYEEASSALRSPNDPNRPLRTDLQSDADHVQLGI